MKFFQVFTLIAHLAVGVQSHNPYRRAQVSNDLSISLAQVPGKSSEVRATITNNGDSDLSLLKIGTILDERPVKKLTVTDENGTYSQTVLLYESNCIQVMMFLSWVSA